MIIILLGPPGCGKTILGKNIAIGLGYKWIDVDEHLLEPTWKCTVATKLKALGSKKFLEEESKVLVEAIETFDNDTVISLTGSNTCKTLKLYLL